ncbi:hypothetical protein [Neisseria sp. Ec49-e6-T10]|uniref:hypothetical protein n=1 Tax=Neisseria sp. Ec49-e6-T10 TaxID=3140744 RepID=UPI003EC08BD8
MKRFLLFFVLMMSVVPAFAGRIIPNYLTLLQIKDVDLSTMQIKLINAKDGFITRAIKKPYQLRVAKTVRIRDENNRGVTYNKLPNFKNKIVAIRFNPQKQINEILILSDEEVEQNLLRIKEQEWDPR